MSRGSVGHPSLRCCPGVSREPARRLEGETAGEQLPRTRWAQQTALRRGVLCVQWSPCQRPFPLDALRCPPPGWHLAGHLVAVSSSDQAFPLPRGGSETQGCSEPLGRELSCIVTAPSCPDTLQGVAEVLKSRIAYKSTFTGASSGRRVQSFCRIMRRSSQAAS